MKLIHIRNYFLFEGGFGEWQKEDTPSFTADFDFEPWIRLLETGEILLGGVRISSSATTSSSMENTLEVSTSRNSTAGTQRNLQFDEKTAYTMDRPPYATYSPRFDPGALGNNVDLPGFTTEPDTFLDGENAAYWMGSENSNGESFKVNMISSKKTNHYRINCFFYRYIIFIVLLSYRDVSEK